VAFAPLINWLNANAEGVTESTPCLIHQDLHPRNILLRQDSAPVVIDWSSCRIGDFREDLCWTALLAGTFVDESLKEAVYDSYAKASKRALSDLTFFEALVSLRRLSDAAITLKAGGEARGMRPDAVREMEGNRQHYANILKFLADSTGVRLPEVARILGA
jgi:aminoglycoside phosphotransferase (APT) family kinase protein